MQGGCWVGPNCIRVFKWSSLEYVEFRLVVECSNLVKWMMNWSRTFWIDCGFGYGPHPHFVCSLFYFHLLLPMQTKEWGAKSRPGVEAMCVIHLNTCLCILPISDLITNVLHYHKCTSCVSFLVRILCHKLSPLIFYAEKVHRIHT